MCEYSEVSHHYPSISEVGSTDGWPEVGSFTPRNSALGLVLVDLSPLLHKSLDWFRSLREILSIEMRSKELDTGLSSSDKAMEDEFIADILFMAFLAEMTTKFNQELYAKLRARKNEPLSSIG